MSICDSQNYFLSMLISKQPACYKQVPRQREVKTITWDCYTVCVYVFSSQMRSIFSYFGEFDFLCDFLFKVQATQPISFSLTAVLCGYPIKVHHMLDNLPHHLSLEQMLPRSFCFAFLHTAHFYCFQMAHLANVTSCERSQHSQ